MKNKTTQTGPAQEAAPAITKQTTTAEPLSAYLRQLAVDALKDEELSLNPDRLARYLKEVGAALRELEPPTIFARIACIMEELGPIAKSRQNKEFNYAYRGIDDILNHLQPLLAKYGVIPTVNLVEERSSTKTSARGTEMRALRNLYHVTFYAVDGSSLTVPVVGEAIDSQDKATNKANTSALKLALIQTFAIATDEIKDTEAEPSVDLLPQQRQAPVKRQDRPAAEQPSLADEINRPQAQVHALPPATDQEVQRCVAAMDRSGSDLPWEQLRAARLLSKAQHQVLAAAYETIIKLGPSPEAAAPQDQPTPEEAPHAELFEDRPPLPPQRRTASSKKESF